MNAFFRENHLVLAVLLGFLLDALLGDPERLYHPVRLIGKTIFFFDRHLNREGYSDRRRFLAGIFTTIAVTAGTALSAGLILFLCFKVSFWFFFAAEVWMSYRILSVKSLSSAAMGVAEALETGNIIESRRRVSMLVGRDTVDMDARTVARADIETVAENTADGCVIPLFYLLLFGPVGAWAYKAVSTMDSMIGYKNHTYLYFGRAAARTDDVLDFFPERLSAFSMLAAAGLLPGKKPGGKGTAAEGTYEKEIGSAFAGFDGANALRIFRRDGRKSPSPNSACCEAVCAGALHIQLGGPASYFGLMVMKPCLGDPDRPIEIADIGRACSLSRTTSLLALLLLAAIRTILVLLL